MLKTNIFFSAGGGLRVFVCVWGGGVGGGGAGRPTDPYTFTKPGS